MCLNDLSGCELVSLASIIAISISKNFDNEEIGILDGLFTSIGDNLALLAVSYTTNDNDTNKEIPSNYC